MSVDYYWSKHSTPTLHVLCHGPFNLTDKQALSWIFQHVVDAERHAMNVIIDVTQAYPLSKNFALHLHDALDDVQCQVNILVMVGATETLEVFMSTMNMHLPLFGQSLLFANHIEQADQLVTQFVPRQGLPLQ